MEKNGKKEEEKYKFPGGQAIDFHTDNSEECFEEPFYKLLDFFDILDNSNEEEVHQIARVGRDLYESAAAELEKRVEFIEEKLGLISIDIASQQIGIKSGTLLGFNIEPKSQKNQERATDTPKKSVYTYPGGTNQGGIDKT